MESVYDRQWMDLGGTFLPTRSYSQFDRSGNVKPANQLMLHATIGEIMPFECLQCGICCMYLGDYIIIEAERGPFNFLACCVSTGTEFIAVIDHDKEGLFSDRSWIANHPSACPFLRPSGEHLVCTIHATSPPQCKAYRCVVFRILSQNGETIGIVTGTGHLHSNNKDLLKVWMEMEQEGRDSFSEGTIKSLLEQRGYICLEKAGRETTEES